MVRRWSSRRGVARALEDCDPGDQRPTKGQRPDRPVGSRNLCSRSAAKRSKPGTMRSRTFCVRPNGRNSIGLGSRLINRSLSKSIGEAQVLTPRFLPALFSLFIAPRFAHFVHARPSNVVGDHSEIKCSDARRNLIFNDRVANYLQSQAIENVG